MDTIAINSRVYGEYGKGGRIRVEVDTIQDGISAWTKEFHDARDIQNLLLGLAPAETAKITDFITRTVNFGEGHVVISCEEASWQMT
jgi:hypothetical protein